MSPVWKPYTLLGPLGDPDGHSGEPQLVHIAQLPALSPFRRDEQRDDLLKVDLLRRGRPHAYRVQPVRFGHAYVVFYSISSGLLYLFPEAIPWLLAARTTPNASLFTRWRHL